jgi:XTP/dITP diphosphohydrolase
VAFEPTGDGGFGYDPIFFVPQLGRTMAQLSPAEKDRISHRGRAIKRALPLLRRLAGSS